MAATHLFAHVRKLISTRGPVRRWGTCLEEERARADSCATIIVREGHLVSKAWSVLIVATCIAMSAPARAQLAGDLVRGQYGLTAGTQAPEGLVLSGWAYNYNTSTIRTRTETPCRPQAISTRSRFRA